MRAKRRNHLLVLPAADRRIQQSGSFVGHLDSRLRRMLEMSFGRGKDPNRSFDLGPGAWRGNSGGSTTVRVDDGSARIAWGF
jgi:hypothetical protein